MDKYIQETRYIYGHAVADERYLENINKLYSDLFSNGNAGDSDQLRVLLEDLINGKSLFKSLACFIEFVHECCQRMHCLPIPAYDERKSLRETMSIVFDEKIENGCNINVIDNLPDRPLEKVAEIMLYSACYAMEKDNSQNFVQQVGRSFGITIALYNANVVGLGPFNNHLIMDLIQIYDNMTILTDCTLEEYKGVVAVFERMISARKLFIQGNKRNFDIYEILLANDVIEFWKVNKSGSDVYESIGMFIEEVIDDKMPDYYRGLWEGREYEAVTDLPSIYVEKMYDVLSKAEERLTEKDLLKVFDSAWYEFTEDWESD